MKPASSAPSNANATAIEPIHNVPTNVITGFLGVGKTTAILHLLRHKPANERWAVLVNEFGEVGIDGALMSGQFSQDNGVFIREVPGGCMCCAAGLPMQIALNMLLARARPDRLLIEPTGLGHPQEVLAALQSESYQDVIQLETVVTLVDARQISDVRYTDHDTFNQQLQIADLVIANKADCYESDEFVNLKRFLADKPETTNIPVVAVEQGEVDHHLLTQPSRHHQGVSFPDVTVRPTENALLPLGVPLFPKEGFLRFHNQGEGFFSLGWIFHSRFQFDQAKLLTLINDLDAMRVKAVIRTTDGVLGCNRTQERTQVTPLEQATDSRFELISSVSVDADDIQQRLLQLVVPLQEPPL